MLPLTMNMVRHGRTFSSRFIDEPQQRLLQSGLPHLGALGNVADASPAAGRAAPSQPQMPLTYSGIKGGFTKHYIRRTPEAGNFSTKIETSRVHNELTELY